MGELLWYAPLVVAYVEKRARQDGSVSYRAQVRVRGYPPEARTFRRKADAVKWARRVESDIDRRRRKAVTSTQRRFTLAQLIEDYYLADLGGLAASDVANRRRMLSWWAARIGSMPVLEVQAGDVAQYLRVLERGEGVSGRAVSVATRNRYLTALSSVLTWGARERVYGYDANPIRGVHLRRKEPRGRVRFLSDEERQQLLAACRESYEPRLYPLTLMAISTGMRQGELLRLRWRDVDFEGERAIIENSKNGDRRAVPLAGPVHEAMRARAKVRLLTTDLVFADFEGRARFPRAAWRKAIHAAKLEDFTFHDCRHTAASYLAMSGATLAEIAEVLGHRTLAMVKRYAHLTESHTLRVARRMAQRFLC